MKFFRNMLLAACVVASSVTAMAQNEKMVVYLSDGTSQAISASDIDHVEFSTNSTVPADAKFQLSVTDVHSLYCTFNAVPAEGVGTYNVMYDLKSVYDQFDSEAALVAEDINLYKQWAQSYQMTFADLLKAVLLTGNAKQLITGICPGKDYKLWAYGLDTEGNQTTSVTAIDFTIPAVKNRISNTIEVTLSENADGVPTATYTPDDTTRYYLSGSVPESATDQEIEDAINSNMSNAIGNYMMQGYSASDAIKALCDKGEITSTLSSAAAGKNYYAVAAYLNEEGAVCSAIFKKKYTGVNNAGTSSVKSTSNAFSKANKDKQLRIEGLRLVRLPR